MKNAAQEFFKNQFQYYMGLANDLREEAHQQEGFIKQLLIKPNLNLDYKYEEGKWSIREVLMHIIDTEIIFTGRALRIARGDTQELPGYDHDAYVKDNDFTHLTAEVILDLFQSQRATSRIIFDTFNAQQKSRSGIAAGNTLLVAKIPDIIIGHCQHHIHILKNRYNVMIYS